MADGNTTPHGIDWLCDLWGVTPPTDEEMAEIEAKYEADKAEREAREAARQARIAALPKEARPLSEDELHRLLSLPINRSPLARADILWRERNKIANLPR